MPAAARPVDLCRYSVTGELGLTPEQQKLLELQVQQGATKGMAKVALRKLGASDEEIEAEFDRLNSARMTRNRGRGGLVLLSGLLLIVLGAISVYTIYFSIGKFSQASVLAMVGGAILAFKGLLKLVSGEPE